MTRKRTAEGTGTMNGNATHTPGVVDAAMPINIVLEAQQWNQVLGALGESPYRIAAPLIQTIGQQLQAVAATVPSPPGNGVDKQQQPADS